MTAVWVHGTPVYGVSVDEETRCGHYHSSLDLVALQFPCCWQYYACRACHDETADHPAMQWTVDQFKQEAVLCGACGHKMTISAYLNCGFACTSCHAPFNPGCKAHYPLYFQL